MTQEKANPSNGSIAWGRYALILGIAAWMFILGILVGRGTAPVQFDTQALQKELAALRDSMVKKEREAAERAMRGEDEKASLGFYEALKKDGPDTSLKAREQPAATSSQSGTTPHKTRAALMPKKKNLAVRATARTSDRNKPSAADQQGKLTIQVASLKDAESAQRIVANLKKHGYPAYLSKYRIADKGLWFRVRVGRYPDEKQAATDMARLTRDQKNPILVEIEEE